jgi:hypothetical protein
MLGTAVLYLVTYGSPRGGMMTINKLTATALSGLFLAIASPVLAKPKNEIVVEVVNPWIALSHSPIFHPGVPDVSTSVCTPGGEKCVTTTVPGHPPSIDNLEYYSQFLYVITPKGNHFMVRYVGNTVVYPPTPGHYTAETDDDKVLVLYVSYANGKSGKIKYRIEGIWPQ